jgi:diacylglycerol O-acyltransferase
MEAAQGEKGCEVRRLSALDASFWYLDDATTHMHVGSVALFDVPEGGFDHERLVRLIGQRIAYVPRYRQRVRDVPFGLGRPVWVDDEYFDLTYHVRRSALPRPGSMHQLEELVARLMSRPLDRSRPLWEMYLVEGLEGDRFALVTKTHQAMVDGIGAVDLVQVLLDDTADVSAVVPAPWRPAPEPSAIELMASTVTETLTRPTAAFAAAQATTEDFASAVMAVTSRIGGLITTVFDAAKGNAQTPLNVPIGIHRRFATADFALSDVKVVRDALGVSINDVLLATAAGGLREWLISRGNPVDAHHSLKVLVPISTPGDATSVSAFLVELPTGEPDPIVRVQQIAYQMQQIKDVDQLIGADAILAAAGFGPATLHALGARIGSRFSHRLFNLVVTNVPGPQRTLFIDGARMVASYPSLPLTKQQALSIALTSYDGHVFVGLTADRDAMPDIPILQECLGSALQELQVCAQSSRKPSRRLRSVPGAKGA